MPRTRCSALPAALTFILFALGAPFAKAANPRWTTGPPYFYVQGSSVTWYTNSPRYFTDPGDLSPFVNHADADAMVAAAASVWNVPTSLLTLAQGGTLAEQVNSTNVYLTQNGLVFPNDVQSTNHSNIQIAVLYDRDGSVTDLLLGGGANDLSGCLQHGVTESVDSIIPSGHIQHAVILLNGRCTTSDPQSMLQMQYQLERAFGRVLGVGWSQLNDNVFTGTPQPTYDQALHWPIMHPIDIICGPYTYQCLPAPFTLRDDDIAAISTLYPVSYNAFLSGKQPTLARAITYQGSLHFPNQEGMAGVNIVAVRNNLPWQVLDAYQDVSTLTGDYGEQFHGNPMTPKPSGLAGSFGYVTPLYDVAGYFNLGYIPIPDNDTALDVLFHTEPINPLYTGAYAIGSYPLSAVAPSGDPVSWRFNYLTPYWSLYWSPNTQNTANGLAAAPGTEASPASIPSGGWWTDTLCGPNQSWTFAHTAWLSVPVRANRSFTAEMTALTESGTATGTKLRPVLGLWRASDPPGTAPTIASAPIAFNGATLGMTSLAAQTTAANTFRLALASETGDGRPDYSYQGRVLYADTVAPTSASTGTTITITGMGFRPGNIVTLGNVTASVLTWSNTSIVATVPYLPAVSSGSVAVDITVTDLSTGGTTTMSAAFQYVYTTPVYILRLVSAPTASQIAALPASPAFALKVLYPDGSTPLAGAPVVFSAPSGSIAFNACGGAPCTVLTDPTGIASIGVTPLTAGPVILQAAAQGQTLQTSFQTVPLVRTASVMPATRYLAAGASASWTAIALFQQQGTRVPQTAVAWSAASGMTLSTPQTTTAPNGTATAVLTAGPLSPGVQVTGTACAWTTVCASSTAIGVDPAQFAMIVTSGGNQSLGGNALFGTVTLQVIDSSGHAVAGASVQIVQTLRQWTPLCPPHSRCPIAPVRQISQTFALSDINGNLSITPLDLGGPAILDIVITTGKQGRAVFTLQRSP